MEEPSRTGTEGVRGSVGGEEARQVTEKGCLHITWVLGCKSRLWLL